MSEIKSQCISTTIIKSNNNNTTSKIISTNNKKIIAVQAVEFDIVSLNGKVFQAKNPEDQKLYLTKNAPRPLVANVTNGLAKLSIELKFRKTVKQIKTITFKNAGAAFISISLGEQILYAETQQFSAEQFEEKDTAKTHNTCLYHVNNKFPFKSSDKIVIRLRPFYDCITPHSIGLYMIEFTGMVVAPSLVNKTIINNNNNVSAISSSCS
jgi:hypothetical protein